MILSQILSIVVLVVFTEIYCDSPEQAFRKHFQACKKFTCNVPQPRSLNISEFVNSSALPKTKNVIFPPYTVLHRCGQAGCCDNGEECLAVEETSLTLTISVKNMIKSQFENITVTNHTKCACQATSLKIK